jgi:hypothetical protein
VALEDSALFAPQEVYICNHPWPYYGNMYGDGFADSMSVDNNLFELWIHAVKYDGREDSISYPLALFDTSLEQSPDWQSIDLNPLFDSDNDSIQSLYFTMFTTDSDPQYGPNTAVYFCMDKLKVIEQGPAPANALAPKAQTHSIAQTAKAVEITDNFPLPSVSGGDVIVYDKQGKVVLQTTVKAGEKINLSKLPKGEYRLRHGHKHIPITKK